MTMTTLQSPLATRRDAPVLAPITTSSTQHYDNPLSSSSSQFSPNLQHAPESGSPKLRFSKDKPQARSKAQAVKSPSVFNLFSRPQLERAQGSTESSVSVHVNQLDSNEDDQPKTSPRHQEGLRSALKRVETVEKSRPPPKVKAVDNHTSRNRNIHNIGKGSVPDPRLRDVWEAPPLSQVYTQAIRHCRLEAPYSGLNSKSHDKKLKNGYKEGAERNGTKSRPSFLRSTSSSPELKQRSQSSTPRNEGQKARKIYVLVTSGYLLQYAAEGSSDRKPEKILKLGLKSAAFASDLVPGRHWVLQIVQTVFDINSGASAPRKSLMAKLGLSSSKDTQNDSETILMVFERPEDMNKWMISIRAAIDGFSGNKCRLPKNTNRKPQEDDRKTHASHQYLAPANIPLPSSGRSSPSKSATLSSTGTTSDFLPSPSFEETDCSSQTSSIPQPDPMKAHRVDLHQQIAAKDSDLIMRDSNQRPIRRTDRSCPRLVAQLPTPPGTGNRRFVDAMDVRELFPLLDRSCGIEAHSDSEYTMDWKPPEVPEIPSMIEDMPSEDDDSMFRVVHIPQQDDDYSENTPPLTGNSLLSQFPIAKGSLESSSTHSLFEGQNPTDPGPKTPKLIQYVMAKERNTRSEQAIELASIKRLRDSTVEDNMSQRTPSLSDGSSLPSTLSSARSSTTFRSSSLQPLQLLTLSETSESPKTQDSQPTPKLSLAARRKLRSNVPVPLLITSSDGSMSKALSQKRILEAEANLSQPNSPKTLTLRRILGEGGSKAPPPSPATPRMLGRPSSIRIKPAPSKSSLASEQDTSPSSPKFPTSDAKAKRDSILVPVVRPPLNKFNASSRLDESSVDAQPV